MTLDAAATVRDCFTEAYDRLASVVEPAWLKELRARAYARFLELGVPTPRQESWKYSDIRKLVARDYSSAVGQCERLSFDRTELLQVPEAADSTLVFIDGLYCRELSSVRAFAGSHTITDLASALATPHVELLRDGIGSVAPIDEQAFVALNTALAENGALVATSPHATTRATVHLLFLAGAPGRSTMGHPRTLIYAREGTALCVVETYAAAADDVSFTNAVTEVIVEEGASVDHYRVQREGELATHVGATDVRLGRDSRYTAVAVNVGAAFSRHDVRVRLAAPGAECRVDGLYVVERTQHTDTHTNIAHLAPHCTSNQLYKGVLDGSARAVFDGAVIVHREAQQTAAHQINRNLLLSPAARIDTKPQLEILADDVVCTHGDTVGALDEEEMFYLASRGVDAETARGLLTYGFAEEVVASIRTDSVRHHLEDIILDRFQRGLKLR
jgi:Fe-S cluster assembly protein SufD